MIRLAFILAVVCLTFGCAKMEGAKCAKSNDCGAGLLCSKLDWTCQTPDAIQCSDVCKSNGWCTARRGACIATRDRDCAASWDCKRYGWCTARSGKCEK